MQQSEQSGGFLRLNVLATALAAGATAVIMAVLSLPLHLMMRAHAMAGPWEVRPGAPLSAPGPRMMHPPMWGAEFAAGWILVTLLVVLIYAGVAGSIFAAIYNAMLSRNR